MKKDLIRYDILDKILNCLKERTDNPLTYEQIFLYFNELSFHDKRTCIDKLVNDGFVVRVKGNKKQAETLLDKYF